MRSPNVPVLLILIFQSRIHCCFLLEGLSDPITLSGELLQHPAEAEQACGKTDQAEGRNDGGVTSVTGAHTMVNHHLMSPCSCEAVPVLHVLRVRQPTTSTDHSSVFSNDLSGLPADVCSVGSSVFLLWQVCHLMPLLVTVNQLSGVVGERVTASLVIVAVARIAGDP